MSAGAGLAWITAGLLLGLADAAPCAAQAGPPPGRVEVGGGVSWLGHLPLGSIDASETTAAGGRLRIFSTSTELASVAGIEGRVSVRIRRSVDAEASASYTKPQLRIALSNDFEAPGTVVATETIRQFTIGGAIVWHLPSRRAAPARRPFLTAGAGYLRQLHEGGTLAATGGTFEVGGGVNYQLVARPRSYLNGLGLRADVRVTARRKGVAFDDQVRFFPSLGGSIFVRF
jgi:hypothetical protein